ncbi:MAG TPA: FkbM family methyltransferase [Pyrinomonadaceae bacterium]|jgi:FkbM family methyltransferase|nr:FkbM family methyltransferase [Pyrinomonadaceae bacterium]
MGKTFYQRIRPFVPNLQLSISHVEPDKRLNVRLRQHLGLVARGALSYEPRYVRALRSLICEGQSIFDVGANIGFYSVLFSGWVGSSGRVVAYEPDSNNLKLLERNVAANKCANVSIRNSALAGKPGTASFSTDPATGATGHLGAGATYGETLFGSGREILVEVEVSSLDHEVELWGAPDLVKMDVEGGEFDALSGGTQTLRQHRPLVVSELSNNEAHGPATANHALKLLRELDYVAWDLDSGERVRDGQLVWTILAVPAERAAEPGILSSLSA